jgi:cation:H+ antiporter
VIFDFLLFGAGFVLLLSGAELLIRSASRAAAALRVPALLVGVLLVGFGTSLPELAVVVDAALVDAGDVAVGSVIGSNLCNGALVLGLAALLRPLPLARRLLRWELPVLVTVSGAVAVFLANAEISRGEAALLLGALAVYVLLAIRATSGARRDGEPAGSSAGPSRWRLAATSALGFGALIVGAQWLVEGATLVARDLGVSEATIAISLVAVGTSLPELATTLTAARHGATELVAGNLIGSNLFNTMAILGLSALVAPLRTADIRAWELAAFVAAPLALAALALGGRVGRAGGGALLAGYGVVLAGLAGGR